MLLFFIKYIIIVSKGRDYMKKPIIGVSSNEEANFDGWFEAHRICYTKSETIDVIEKVGGMPLIIPILEDKESINNYLDLVDALIITGGHDVHPMFYHEDMQEKCNNTYPRTDLFDWYLARLAIERKIPLIVMCRGLQITNVAHGGTLYQDINSELNTNIKHHAPLEGDQRVHKITIKDADSLFSKLTGITDKINVNSIHHQAIKDLAPIFKVVATANDGIIELVELKDGNQFFLGFQFHPEILSSSGDKLMLKIFQGLLDYITEE